MKNLAAARAAGVMLDANSAKPEAIRTLPTTYFIGSRVKPVAYNVWQIM